MKPETARKPLLLGIRSFLTASVAYLLSRLPLANEVLSDVRILNPSMRTDPSSVVILTRIANKICPLRCDTILDEWKVYQQDTSFLADTSASKSHKQQIDHYWRDVFSVKTSFDKPKYEALQGLIKSIAVIPHGNADVERGLSIAKRSLTEDRTLLSDESVVANRIVQDAVTFTDPEKRRPESISITRELLTSARNSHAAYAKRLEDERFQKEQDRVLNEIKKKEEEQRKLQLEKTEEMKKAVYEKEASLLDREKECSTDLSVADKLLKDGNEKLVAAIKNKSMDEICVAQIMIEAAQRKSSSATSTLSDIRYQVSVLNSQKRRLLDGCSRETVTSKQRKLQGL